MRMLPCEEKLMVRTLHPRWPYRRSHDRHDFHWLVRVRPPKRCVGRGRRHSLAGLPPRRSRPHAR